jgi:snRNA-activating protein complex subunit 3
MNSKKRQSEQPFTKAATSLHETPFSSLEVRINEPYWLLHQGNCEHFIIIESIRYIFSPHFDIRLKFSRLQHPNDPQTGYPLTMQLVPTTLDLCRACNKAVAVLSVVGESPCVLCKTCWSTLGDPGVDEGVVIVPLPKYEFGY